jgi:hypothetical protein
MLMLMSSEKWLVKIWAAAVQAALAAVAFAPKLVSKFAVNVGVITKAIPYELVILEQAGLRNAAARTLSLAPRSHL